MVSGPPQVRECAALGFRYGNRESGCLDLQAGPRSGDHPLPPHALQDLPLIAGSLDAETRLGGQASRSVLALGFIVGLASFAYYYARGLTTAHYDAKAHLVLARGVLDSTRPGYAQLGVNWLPLTHLLYLPFASIDGQYRSAFLPSLLSVISFALSAWLVFRIVARFTRLGAAGLFAAVYLVANSNLQYLQSCPLTEPLYILLLLSAVDSFILWRESAAKR